MKKYKLRLKEVPKYKKITKMHPSGYGHWKVWCTYYGKEICATTTNMPAIDAFRSNERGWKTAGNMLYDFVVYKNKIQ